MTRQIRTWHEREGAEGEPRCWDVRINGAPVPGGCIVQTDDGAFEVRYPRLATRTVPTLEEAKRFVRAVVEGEEPGRVEVLDYRRAMARCTRAKRSENGLSGPIPFKSFEAARAGALPQA